MMCGMDSFRILIPLHSEHGEDLVGKPYRHNGHSEHPKLESDKNNVWEGVEYGSRSGTPGSSYLLAWCCPGYHDGQEKADLIAYLNSLCRRPVEGNQAFTAKHHVGTSFTQSLNLYLSRAIDINCVDPSKLLLWFVSRGIVNRGRG